MDWYWLYSKLPVNKSDSIFELRWSLDAILWQYVSKREDAVDLEKKYLNTLLQIIK